MLKLEAAKVKLAEWRLQSAGTHGEEDDDDDDRVSPSLERIKNLPSKARSIALGLMGRAENGDGITEIDDWNIRTRTKVQSAIQLDELAEREQHQIFEAFLPGMAEWIVESYKLLRTFPFQDNEARKPFRSPHARHTAARRSEWLDNLREALEVYRSEIITPTWIAAWTPYLGRYTYSACVEENAYLLAAVLNGGGKQADEVLEILKASATNEHEIGSMGRHVPRALLCCSNPEAWQFMENMLLAAQRQEGLRQSILETVDEAHPEAFRRMVRLILEHDLVRFSSVVRAVDVWVGLAWDSASQKVIKDTLASILRYLDDPTERGKAIDGKDPEATYLGLWAEAFENVETAIERASPLVAHKKLETRFAAVTFLCRADVSECAPALARAAKDEDLRVALLALGGIKELDSEKDSALMRDIFGTIESVLQRMSKDPTDLKPLVWPWMKIRADRKQVATRLVDMLGDRSPLELAPYLPMLDNYQRKDAFELITGLPQYDAVARKVLLDCTIDATLGLAALAALEKARVTPEEAQAVEKLLMRKAAGTRRGVLSLLASQTDESAMISADRLLLEGNVEQRLGGLELLRVLATSGRQTDNCRSKAAAFAKGRKKLSQEEQTQLAAIEKAGEVEWTLDNALGLMDPSKLTPRVAPRPLKVTFFTSAAYRCLESLDALVHEHRSDEVRSEAGDKKGAEVKLLGEMGWWFCSVDYTNPPEEAAKKLPLRAIWETWWNDRPNDLRDHDGFELLRAAILVDARLRNDYEWKESLSMPVAKKAAEAMNGLAPLAKVRYCGVIDDVIDWLLFLHPVAGVAEYLLDATESSLAMVPKELLGQPPPKKSPDGRIDEPGPWHRWVPFHVWKSWAEKHLNQNDKAWSREQKLRLWRLQHWQDIPTPGQQRERPDFSLSQFAWQNGEANDHDILDHLLGPRDLPAASGNDPEDSGYASSFGELSEVTDLSSGKQLASKVPDLPAHVDRCRDRILEIELARGETPTAATNPALALQSLYGIETLVRIFTEINRSKLKTMRYSWQSDGERAATLTHLISITQPLPEDTPESFDTATGTLRKQGVLSDSRLLELAFIAPQWLDHVEKTLGWNGLREGVYWYLAHMAYSDKGVLDQRDEVESDDSADEESSNRTTSVFDRIVAARTPLTGAQRAEGAVDVAWFRKAYEAVGSKRWQMIADAAKHASSPQRANKAEHLGRVILGKVGRASIVGDIRKKKLKHSVRLLGLLPLPVGPKRMPELVARYRVLHEYQRYARGLSAMTKPGAMRAVEIGLANLASTAGYPDALRLTWALEAEGLADLKKGPVNVTANGVTVSLAIGEDFLPQVHYAKAGKPLKSGPAAIKKNKKVAELLERASELKRQTPRIKASLETMLCRGDEFAGSELRELADHPLLWPHLSRLVLVGDGILGYPDKRGQALRNVQGKLEPVKKNERLRIAHPLDLYESKQWPKWQHECFAAERVQPCKQVFRELYLITKAERDDKLRSHRYAGQQIQPRQAMALFGARGWRTQDGVEKIFHDAEIYAAVSFVGGCGSPLDVEGLTLEAVSFYKRDQYKPFPLVDVPKRIFSEVMRDLDLVVSVAHRGGVDPEASASTVEMRTSLLRETCDLMSIKNVKFKSTHAVIKGKLAEYSVHLGSGVVHRLPGGSLCIVAVGAQHRGRLFLPFADDDPRTAEVISKVLLLARDEAIQDPTILEQFQR